MTDIEMLFLGPDGSPVADSMVEVRLTESSFLDPAEGILMPRTQYVETDAQGRATISLIPTAKPYTVEVQDVASGSLLRYSFYVPDSPTPLKLQDIVLVPPPTVKAYDEAAIITITDAKIASIAAQTAAETAQTAAAVSETNAAGSASASAINATNAATSESNAYTYMLDAQTAKDAAEASVAALAAPGGAGLVGYTLSDPGAVPRKVEDKLRESGSPLDFGAVGDGQSHPASERYASLAALQADYPFATSLVQELDFLAWQAALNAGGCVTSPKQRYKMCNADPLSHGHLTVISGDAWAMADGAVLDFTDLLAVVDNTHYIVNYDFALSSDWQNATIYAANQHTDAVFGGGSAECVDVNDPNVASYFEFGQQVTLAPGKYKASVNFEVSLGGSYAEGNVNPPYASIRFCDDGVGQGGNFSGRSASIAGLAQVVDQGPQTRTLQFEFIVETETTSWLCFQCGGYGSFSVTEFDIVPGLTNSAILITRDDATEHYPIMHPLQGLYVIGSGKDNGLNGITYNSYVNIDGNHNSLKDCIVTGFARGVEPKTGAYLLVLDNVNLHGNGTCFYFGLGNANAGENIRIINGGMYNSYVAIENPGGAEITLVMTAVDYNRRAVWDNAGKVELHGLRIEMNNDYLGLGDPLFWCTTGSITWYGGFFLGAGAIGDSLVPPIKLDSPQSSITFFGTQLYNLSSAEGVMASGEGIVKAYGWKNAGNPNLGTKVISRAAGMDALGGCGNFEPSSSVPFIGRVADTAPSLVGGFWPDSGAVETDAWNSNHYTCAPSTDYAMEGTRSLKVTKTGVGVGTQGQLVMLVPVKPGEDVFGEAFYLFPEAVGTGTAQLYHRLYWTQVISYDTHGRPVFGHAAEFKGEVDLTVPLEGDPVTWVRRSISTAYTTSSNQSSGAPEWATHLAVVIDHTSLPSMSYYIDGLIANVL